MEMYYKQGILKSLESLSGKGGKKSSQFGDWWREWPFLANNKKIYIGENVRPSKLLFSQNPEPRLALLGRRLPASRYHGVFSILTIHFPERHTANSNETESSEKPFR